MKHSLNVSDFVSCFIFIPVGTEFADLTSMVLPVNSVKRDSECIFTNDRARLF